MAHAIARQRPSPTNADLGESAQLTAQTERIRIGTSIIRKAAERVEKERAQAMTVVAL
jgi:hypothetical protein